MSSTDSSLSSSRRAVLVTGGAGFIGSHLADALVFRGEQVVVLDDLSTGDRARLSPAVRFVQGDIRDAALPELLKTERVGTIFHLAAQVDVRKSVSDPVGDASVNVLGTVNVAHAAARAGVAQIIFASSGGAIYGDPQGDRADESHPLCPCSPYGAAKLAGEKYLQALSIDGGFAVTLLRFANVYGPRQDGRGEAGVVGIWMRRLLDGDEAVIYGDGLQTRDFVYVADVVAANLAAHAGRVAGTINVGTGVETDLVDLYRKTAVACDSGRPAIHAAAKPGEQRRSVLDPTRAGAALGLTTWVALDQGLRSTAEWFRLQPTAGSS